MARGGRVLFLLLVLAQAPVWADDQATAPATYTLKSRVAATGSMLKRDLALNSDVPFDKTYAEMTPEQQAQVKARYGPMAPGDEPPFPLYGLGPVFRTISSVEDVLQVDGDLYMLVDVDSHGEARAISLIGKAQPEIVQAAAKVLMLEKYKPAVCAGQPCAMQFPFNVHFSMNLD